MKTYTTRELESFLMSIDQFLTKKVEIIVIGGTAAALGYNVNRATQDIDTWNSTKDVEYAHKKAVELTGLQFPDDPSFWKRAMKQSTTLTMLCGP